MFVTVTEMEGREPGVETWGLQWPWQVDVSCNNYMVTWHLYIQRV